MSEEKHSSQLQLHHRDAQHHQRMSESCLNKAKALRSFAACFDKASGNSVEKAAEHSLESFAESYEGDAAEHADKANFHQGCAEECEKTMHKAVDTNVTRIGGPWLMPRHGQPGSQDRQPLPRAPQNVPSEFQKLVSIEDAEHNMNVRPGA